MSEPKSFTFLYSIFFSPKWPRMPELHDMGKLEWSTYIDQQSRRIMLHDKWQVYTANV
jgi:hypothetical protein